MRRVHHTERLPVVHDAADEMTYLDPPKAFAGRHKVNLAAVFFYPDETTSEPVGSDGYSLEEFRYGVDKHRLPVPDEHRDQLYEIVFGFDPERDDPYVELTSTTVDVSTVDPFSDIEHAETEFPDRYEAWAQLVLTFPPDVREDIDYVRIEVPGPAPDEYLFADIVAVEQHHDDGSEKLAQTLSLPEELGGHTANLTYLSDPDGSVA